MIFFDPKNSVSLEPNKEIFLFSVIPFPFSSFKDKLNNELFFFTIVVLSPNNELLLFSRIFDPNNEAFFFHY